MQIKRGVIPAAFAGLILVMTQVAAQGPPQTPPQPGAPQGQPPAGGRGQGRGAGRGTFPAQQRPPEDPAVVERGKAIYSSTCSACHGVDARGGQLGGPNLLRSQLVLNDQAGELILPIIRGARAERGMPPLPMSDEDAKAAAVYVHSLQAAGRPQGAPPDSGVAPPNALVGDASAGETYFKAKCSSCHSPGGDLSGIGTRLPEAKMLQVAWVTGSAGSAGRRGGRGGGSSNGRPITATVTMSSGEKIEGRLVSIDHFLVTLMMADDTVRSILRDGDRPKVEIHDPLAAHKALFAVLTDRDMHDVTAYLATLK